MIANVGYPPKHQRMVSRWVYRMGITVKFGQTPAKRWGASGSALPLYTFEIGTIRGKMLRQVKLVLRQDVDAKLGRIHKGIVTF